MTRPPRPLRPQVRLLIAGGGSPLGVLAEIVKKEGFSTLYTGLSAGILRQITYTSSRMGIFKCAPPSRLACTPVGLHPRIRTHSPPSCATQVRGLWACPSAALCLPVVSPNRNSGPSLPSSLTEKLKEANQGKPIPLWQKAGAGAFRTRLPGAAEGGTAGALVASD